VRASRRVDPHLCIPRTNAKLAIDKSPSRIVTLLPKDPSAMPKLAVSVVFPVPPLPEVIDIERGLERKGLPQCLIEVGCLKRRIYRNENSSD